jgi:pyrimidine operon attenuation protein/uracil phosphoribosyltransferase
MTQTLEAALVSFELSCVADGVTERTIRWYIYLLAEAPNAALPWLAERLHKDMGLGGSYGTISSSMHRDDFAKRGLAAGGQTKLPFAVQGAHIVVLDDVLFTGRTIRAVMNELFDYGRPASVKLAVMVDRGGRELPIQADFAAARVSLEPSQSLALARAPEGGFSFDVKGA